MHPLLTQHLSAIRQVFRDNSVKRAYAFSSVCTDAFKDDSDVDILMEGRRGLKPRRP